MIHVLHSALCELLQKLLLRFVKMEVLCQKTGKHLCEIDVNDVENMCTLETLEVGEATKKAMSTSKKEQHKSILLEMRGFFCKAAEYLQKNLHLRNMVLNDVQCPSPVALFGSSADSQKLEDLD